MNRVALMQNGIGDAVGGSGAQRFFIDVYNWYYSQENQNVKLYFLTDPESHAQYTNAKFFKSDKAADHFVALRRIKNRFKFSLENLDLLLKIIRYRIQLIHVCQYYTQEHYHRIKFIEKLPSFIRPKVVVNYIHANFPTAYFDPAHPYYKPFHERFDSMFNELKIDAVYSWYKLFCSTVAEKKMFRHPVHLHAIEYYCCNTDKFKPADKKENLIVFAARLDEQKNPMMFLNAVKLLSETDSASVNGWKFLVCGKGPLESEVSNFISANKLSGIVEFKDNISDMSEIFSKSKCFVSTQDLENFTSLSMNEAMAAGNAIIARNVGQTDYYVKDGLNGFIIHDDTYQGLAACFRKFISNPVLQESQMKYSLGIINETHNQTNFFNELSSFWNHVINLKKSNA